MKDKLDECIKALQPTAIVTLEIGTEGEQSSVELPQSLLDATSDFFRKALQDDRFKEGQTKVITFEDDDVEAWKVLFYWILHRQLPEISKLAHWGQERSSGNATNKNGLLLAAKMLDSGEQLLF